MSVKISQLGSEFDLNLAYENMREFYLKLIRMGRCILILIQRSTIVFLKFNILLID